MYETQLFQVTTATTYSPPRAVRAETRLDAAERVAATIARKWYGRRGYCHHVREDCRTMDGRETTFEAFIGYPSRSRDGCQGRNVWIYVGKAR